MISKSDRKPPKGFNGFNLYSKNVIIHSKVGDWFMGKENDLDVIIKQINTIRDRNEHPFEYQTGETRNKRDNTKKMNQLFANIGDYVKGRELRFK